ncbi:MAG TPA: hypothetical protein VMN35_00405 [Gaiellaceae bacterium]|nr:hypothetical protein [Gaiellaceae bacterium]
MSKQDDLEAQAEEEETGYGAAAEGTSPDAPPQVHPDPALQPGQPGQPPRIEPEPPDPQQPWDDPQPPRPPQDPQAPERE